MKAKEIPTRDVFLLKLLKFKLGQIILIFLAKIGKDIKANKVILQIAQQAIKANPKIRKKLTRGNFFLFFTIIQTKEINKIAKVILKKRKDGLLIPNILIN